MAGTVIVQTNELAILDAAVFGAGQMHQARRFACRVLALPELKTLSIDPASSEARIAHRPPRTGRRDFLRRLAEAVDGNTDSLHEDLLPSWPDDEAVTLTRVGELVTVLDVLDIAPGCLRIRDRYLSMSSQTVARRTARALQSLPGIAHCTVHGGVLTLRFDPSRIDAARVIRAAEMQLSAERPRAKGGALPAVSFGIANTTVGLSTVGELLLPVATPVATGMLVAAKLGVVRDAAVQLGRGKIGVPLFDVALLTCSIVTGQVLAYALTDWSLRFWQQRWRDRLSAETERLLDDTVPLAERVRILTPEGTEAWTAAALLTAGDCIRVEAGEAIPADGRVAAGDALVDERVVGGTPLPRRKPAGSAVLSGSTLLAGRLDIQVQQTGPATTAARIAANVAEAVTLFPHDHTLRARSRRLADRTVLPTLATAGVGWAAGDLITVGAILHQDWISGPALAVPLLTLNRIRSALKQGALVRNATVLLRLGESDFVVLDGDDPILAAPGLELAALHSRLADGDALLRHAAGASLFLGDERAEALGRACRERGLVVRRPVLSALTPDGVEVCVGGHVIRLVDGPAQPAGTAPELLMEIDGHDVARLIFRKGARPRSAEAIARLRAAGLKTFLMTSAPEQHTLELARSIGTDLAGGELDAHGKIRFLQGLQRRGVRPIVVGNLTAHPELAQNAHLAVTVGGLNGHTVGDVVLLGPSYDSLAELVELARSYDPEILQAARRATLPNLLCIAGAFAGLLNGITAGIIANIGVANVDRQLRKALKATGHANDAGRYRSAG